MNARVEATTDREIVTERLINAPRELVWKAWTDPKHLEQWWGPTGFTTTTKEFDFKPGGVWFHTMHGPDGTDYPNEIYYEEILEPSLITYTHGGGEVGANDAQFHSTITFDDQDGKTLLTMRAVFDTVAQREHVVKMYHAIAGGQQTIARLDEYVMKLS